ncbi:hypothetical protein RIF29_38377 [Crotalaria pallida]|uniref:Uncharacterized protein n=1 Tax=Crotalaria pallida TaxID=3830 RepID=A0AAN9DZ38_CROPI
MTAAEIRAVWQRTANGCFVQEDAKRAPKLACATSKLVDTGQVSATYESDHAAVNVAAFSRKSSFLNLPPNLRWWLMQPNQGFQNFLTYEQLNALEDEQTNDFSLDSDYSWIEGDKARPWWRTTDRDELASFVSQKSVDHVENCDLPPPQKKYLTREPCADLSDDKIKTRSFGNEAKSRCFSNLTEQEKGSLDSELTHNKQWPSGNKRQLYYASGKSSRYFLSS